MTYYESQLARLGEITKYGVVLQFTNENGYTNHFTLMEEDFEKVKAVLLEIEKAKQ